MTLTTTITESTGTGDAVEDTFAYAFKIQDDADLEVYVDAVLQSSGYSVTGAGDATGGTVVFTSPPANKAVILMKRNVRPLTQLSDLVTFGGNKIQKVEDAIDRLYMAFQEIDA